MTMIRITQGAVGAISIVHQYAIETWAEGFQLIRSYRLPKCPLRSVASRREMGRRTSGQSKNKGMAGRQLKLKMAERIDRQC